MILDYVPSSGAYILKVPRTTPVEIRKLMVEHGLDYSIPASSSSTAVLFTHEPYAAASFVNIATDRAKLSLQLVVHEIEASWRADSGLHISCPSDQELWPFQKANIEYALKRKNTLVGDQPGLGKTPVAICYANEIRAKKVLVICPASIRLQWVKRIREWTTLKWPYTVYPILHSRHGVHPNAEWTICSYDLARVEAIGKALTRPIYDLLILDEAHYLKTTDSQRTRAIFGGGHGRSFAAIAERSRAILALTGTPLPNRPREAYTLCRALCFDSIDWLSEDSFQERFNPSMRIERYDQASGRTTFYNDERSGRHSELQNRLRANFMVRHLKKDVMPQLKMPVYDLIQVEETGPVKQALKAESLLEIDPDNLAGADAAALGHVARVRRMMGLALAPQVAHYVDMLIEGGETKLVVFAWHIEVMDILQKALGKHGVIRIDGTTGPARKEFLIHGFIHNQNIQVALGNILSMGTGTDGLQQVSCHALIAEPSWTPGENIQCFDRLDRGGQRQRVQGDIFVAPNSFAERVLATALRKNQTVHMALDRKNQIA